MESVWSDIRYALRTFRANPGLTAVAGLALAFGLIALLPALVPPTPVALSFDFRLDPRVLMFTLAPQTLGYSEAQITDLYRRLSERLAAVPGVERVSMASHLPLDSLFGGGAVLNVTVPGHEPPAGEQAFAFRSNVVEPG